MRVLSKDEYLRETDDRPRLHTLARIERPVVRCVDEPARPRRPIETVDTIQQRPSKELTDAEVEAVGRATIEALKAADGPMVVASLLRHARKRLRGEWLTAVEEAAKR